MNIVLDTNVIISAALSPHGNCAKIIDMLTEQNNIQLYYGYEICVEYTKVLSRPRLKLAADVQFAIIETIKETGVLINPPLTEIPLPDESDRIFYDTAKASEAMLITGNLKHYPIEDWIVSPTQFLETFSKN
ncbi:MAG: putative toxin-antitoxin system toxin component, PIN family [Oscillospiraceae bacterium]|nr:putative toxin-antitoxin system toxin component, PIN family [Oscillospiraceae bacterium]